MHFSVLLPISQSLDVCRCAQTSDIVYTQVIEFLLVYLCLCHYVTVFVCVWYRIEIVCPGLYPVNVVVNVAQQQVCQN